jgi:hypothetical protein
MYTIVKSPKRTYRRRSLTKRSRSPKRRSLVRHRKRTLTKKAGIITSLVRKITRRRSLY